MRIDPVLIERNPVVVNTTNQRVGFPVKGVVLVVIVHGSYPKYMQICLLTPDP